MTVLVHWMKRPTPVQAPPDAKLGDVVQDGEDLCYVIVRRLWRRDAYGEWEEVFIGRVVDGVSGAPQSYAVLLLGEGGT